MSVIIGEVTTIPRYEKCDKEQVMKLFEEASEIYNVYEVARKFGYSLEAGGTTRENLEDEAADLITALCDLLAGAGITDMTAALERCVERNKERGRL